MNSQNIDEDSVDVEALQAQIDLSMSFAQNLVSSWVKPLHNLTSSRNKDLEKELLDYMRQPPRLGVGATIPDGHNQGLSRETARLKGKLTGSKRPREQDDVGPSQPSLDDEDESRTNSIKKKERTDPFDVVHGRKKKKHQTIAMTSVQLALRVPIVDQTKNDSSDEAEDVNAMLNDSTPLDVSPVKTKKTHETQTPAEDERFSDTTKVTSTTQAPQSDGSQQERRILATGDQLSVVHKHPLSGNKSSALQDTPNITSPEPAKPPKSLPPELAYVPLLNLNVPVLSDHESDGDPVAGTPSSTPKKKRRRRKKKKHLTNPDCTSPSATQIPPIQ